MPPKTGKRAVDTGVPSPAPTRVQPLRGMGANQQHLESLGTPRSSPSSSPGALPENEKEQEETEISTVSASLAVDESTDANAPPAAAHTEPNNAPTGATTSNASEHATDEPGVSTTTNAPAKPHPANLSPRTSHP